MCYVTPVGVGGHHILRGKALHEGVRFSVISVTMEYPIVTLITWGSKSPSNSQEKRLRNT